MNRNKPRSEPGRQMTLKDMLTTFNTLRFAVLATSNKGMPYTSLIAFALTPDCQTLIFATPKNTRKYENLTSESAVSILLNNCSQDADDLNRAQAVTLLGTAEEVTTSIQKAEYRQELVKRHPELADFLDEPETSLIAVTIKQAVHVAHFQNISRWP